MNGTSSLPSAAQRSGRPPDTSAHATRIAELVVDAVLRGRLRWEDGEAFTVRMASSAGRRVVLVEDGLGVGEASLP